MASRITFLTKSTDHFDPGKIDVVIKGSDTLFSNIPFRLPTKYPQSTLCTLCGHPKYTHFQTTVSYTFQRPWPGPPQPWWPLVLAPVKVRSFHSSSALHPTLSAPPTYLEQAPQGTLCPRLRSTTARALNHPHHRTRVGGSSRCGASGDEKKKTWWCSRLLAILPTCPPYGAA